MTFIVPKINASPSAMSAYELPVRTPDQSACRTSSVMAREAYRDFTSPRHAGKRHFSVGVILRPDDNDLLALMLAHPVREIRVVAFFVELDAADQRVLVGLVKLRSNSARLERACVVGAH